jgi:hypothetical protein
MSPFTAEIVDAADPATPAFMDWTWAFVLNEGAAQTTRLVARVRANYKPEALRVAVVALVEPAHFLMERGMLYGLKRRAESGDAGRQQADV